MGKLPADSNPDQRIDHHGGSEVNGLCTRVEVLLHVICFRDSTYADKLCPVLPLTDEVRKPPDLIDRRGSNCITADPTRLSIE